MSRQYQLDAEHYHGTDSPTYQGDTDGGYKDGQRMVKVLYKEPHHNPTAPAGMQGQGDLEGKWVFNEEPGKAEGLLDSGIELVMDSRLEPNASLGLHKHGRTEEIYYLLEGSLMIRLYNEQEKQYKLEPGDAHCIKPGQSHFVQAGAQGARFMVIAAKVQGE